MTGRRRDYLSSHTVEASGCWNYTGTINKGNGYGQTLQTTAHRYFYEALVGLIPVGLQIDHLCRNKSCVNPEHLEPVTPLENQRRRFSLVTHCVRGHELTGENLITRIRGGAVRRACRTCAIASSSAYRSRIRKLIRA
jgi:hypothetical protein